MVYGSYVFFSWDFQAIFADEAIPRSLEDDAVLVEKRQSRQPCLMTEGK